MRGGFDDAAERALAKARRLREQRPFPYDPAQTRVIRQSARLPLVDVAQAIGVDAAELSRLERGLRQPSPEVAERWAALLDRLQEITAA